MWLLFEFYLSTDIDNIRIHEPEDEKDQEKQNSRDQHRVGVHGFQRVAVNVGDIEHIVRVP